MSFNAPAVVAPQPPAISRNVLIATCVVVLHVLALWALQSGLLRRAVEVIVPVQLLAEFVTPPAPKVAPPVPTPSVQPAPKVKTASAPPPPMPIAVKSDTPAPTAPVGVTTAPAPAPAIAAPVAAAPAASPAPAAPPRVELPSKDADYLKNPKPVYPSQSERLREQGTAIHSVLIGIDGLPVSATLIKSSGFDRLDRAAYKAVMRWQYVPGKHNGVPTAMSFNVPIVWELTE